MMDAGLEMRTLGGVSILCDGQPVHFEQRKTAALLIYLAYTGSAHPRDVLAEMFWPGRGQTQALSNLRVALADLKTCVSQYISTTREALAMNPESDWRLDAAAFAVRVVSTDSPAALLEEALKLYRGAFLEGFTVASPGFEQWAMLERERLQSLAVIALQRLIDVDLAAGRYAAVLSRATRLLQIDPLCEKGHERLMLALALTAQPGAALAQYDLCRRLLAEELEMEPSSAITALAHAIRDGTLTIPPG